MNDVATRTVRGLKGLQITGAVAAGLGVVIWYVAAQAAAQAHNVNALASTLSGAADYTRDTVPADAWVIVGIVVTVLGAVLLLAWLAIKELTRPATQLQS